MGQGSGLQPYLLGQPGGVESVTLTANQFAGHTHALQAAAAATTATPGSGVVLGTPAAATPTYATAGTPAQLVGSTVSLAPAATAHMRIGSRAWRSTTSSRSLEFFRRRTDEPAASRQERNRWQIPLSARSRCFRTTLPHLDGPFARANCCRSARTRRFSRCSAPVRRQRHDEFSAARSARPRPDRARPGAWAVELQHGWRSGRGSRHADHRDDPGPFARLPGVRGCRDHQCAERRLACRRAVRRARRRLPVNTYTATGSTVSLAAGQVAAANGGGAPHNNLQPYLTRTGALRCREFSPPAVSPD